MGTAADRRASHAERGTARGQRTRRLIVDAARRVFERDGYIDANIDDIVSEAGVARGSFYTYFPSKLEVFRELSHEVGALVDEAVAPCHEAERLDPIAALARSNLRYIQVYRDNAALYGLVEQVATIDPAIHRQRLAGRRANVERVGARIKRWQKRGIADTTVDPATTAAALVSMTSNFCYWWFVGGDAYDEEQAAATLTDMWIRAVGLRQRPATTGRTR
jgi:AcrR family transcriptional regulator